MYWWLFIRPIPSASQGKKAAEKAAAEAPRGGPPQQLAAPPITAPEPVPPSPAPTVSEDAEPARNGTSKAEASQGEVSKAEVARVEVARADAAKAEATRKTGMRTLQLRFRAESWVEVRDAQGTVLFSRLNASGSQAEVVGRPPLSVVVGNAPEVGVRYEGRDFPLEPHTKVAVARFTLE
jgi:cytoskeleton protein RodZ